MMMMMFPLILLLVRVMFGKKQKKVHNESRVGLVYSPVGQLVIAACLQWGPIDQA